MAGRALSFLPECANRQRWHARGHLHDQLEQIRAQAVQGRACSPIMERIALSNRMAALALRNVLPSAAYARRGPWRPRCVFHTGLQPAVGQPGWLHVDEDAT